MYKKTLLAITLFGLTFCTPDTKTGETNEVTVIKDKYTLQAKDQITFEIDSLTSYQAHFLERIDIEGKEYLAYENDKKPSIQIFDLETRELEKEINLAVNGPNGIKMLRGFHIHTLDSIFVINGPLFNVFMFNANGEVLKKYSLNETLPDLSSSPVCYSTRALIFKPKTKELLLSGSPERDYSKAGYWAGHIAIKLDLLTEKATYEYQGPPEYHETIYGAFFSHYSFLPKGDSDFVYAFTFDSELFVTDLQGKYEKHYAGSKYFDEIPEKDNRSHEQFYIESNSYGNMIYDPWRQVYYRFAYKAIDLIDEYGQRNFWKDKPPSIIILTEDFEKVGEVDLPRNRYFIGNNSFVGKNGLYISNNHNKNPGTNENQLSFTLFTLETL